MPQSLARALLPLPPRLIDVAMLSRFFAAAASLSARSIGYARSADLILADELTAERIVRLFSSSASKRWREDCSLIVLVGSIAEYHASPQTWRPEPSATLARGLVGSDFAHVSDVAARFVANHWFEIEALAVGAAAA
jgi:hypothetical protein